MDEDTDVLDEKAVLKNWSDFEQSDRAELKQFINEKVFVKVKLDQLPKEVVLVDATWVRKYTRTDKGLKPKSRLCARGFWTPGSPGCPQDQRRQLDFHNDWCCQWRQLINWR